MNALRHPASLPRRRRGFALLEALVALAVVALAMMVLAAAQAAFTTAADAARQNAEATRLAQERMERLRAYTQIDSAAGVTSWDGLATGSDTPAAGSNTAYTRTWSLGGSITDPLRSARVQVSWTDRAGTTQSVALGSVISKTDPAYTGALGFPLPQNTTLKRPKNRNLNIPVPALDLENGTSVHQISPTLAVVFTNDGGYLVKRCNFVVDDVEDLAACENYSGFILAGYVSLSGTSTFPAGLRVNTALLTGPTEVECSIGNAVNQNTGAPIAGYKYYMCVFGMPTSASWSGKVRLAGMATGTDYLVCRFQFPAAAGVSANQRNVQPYANVAESLDTQNYVITTASSCPMISSLATTQHQNCRSSNPNNNAANRTTDCPAT